MSDFDTRPKGTVMYGAFAAFAPAERALRVLKNAGYARASLEEGDAAERSSSESAVVVVDAAAAGATRAAEILEEHGAQIRFAPERVTPERAFIAAPQPLVLASADQEPGVRRRSGEAQLDVAGPNVPAAPRDVVIVTRSSESVLSDG